MAFKTNQIQLTTGAINGYLLQSDASGNASWISFTPGGAPSDATYVTLSSNGTLTNERILTGTANQITITDNGAGSTVVLSTPQNIHTTATPTFNGLTLSNIGAGSILFGGTAGLISQDNANLFWDDTNNRLGIGTASPATPLDVNGTATINSLIIDGVAGNSLIVDTSTLIVDAMTHRVGVGTTTPGYKLTVAGGGVVDFFGGRFNCNDTTGMTTISDLTVNNVAAISTGNITTGNITTINATTGNIVTVSATTVGANTVNADEIFVSKNQNAATQLHINNTTAGTDAIAGIIMGTDTTGVLSLLMTSSLFTGFPNAAALTVNAEGGLYIENTLGDVIIEPLQENDGNGFNVNITASDGFDSGA